MYLYIIYIIYNIYIYTVYVCTQSCWSSLPGVSPTEKHISGLPRSVIESMGDIVTTASAPLEL